MNERLRGSSRRVAVLLSGVACPGAGQLYYGRYVRGVLLIAASLALVGALFLRIWDAMLDITMSLPPEEVLGDVFGIAHRLVSENMGFFSWLFYAFVGLWVYGIVDALVKPAPRDGVSPDST